MDRILLLWILILPISVSGVMKDIVFLLDESGSVSDSQFNQAVEFLLNVTQFLNIGNNSIHVSIVAFDDTPDKIFDLNSYPSKHGIIQAMKALQVQGSRGGGTQTDVALEYVASRFNHSTGGRPGAEKTVVVLTDGQSYNTTATISSANRLRRMGIDVIGIGIGFLFSGASNQEIVGIGGGPNSGNVMTVGDFKYLCNLVPSLVPKLDPTALNAIINRCPTEPTYPQIPTMWNIPTSEIPTKWNIPSSEIPTMWNIPTSARKEKEESSSTYAIVGATIGIAVLVASVVIFFIARKQFRNRKTSPRKVIASRPPCRTVFNPALLRNR